MIGNCPFVEKLFKFFNLVVDVDADGATAAAVAWLVGDVVLLLPDMDQDALGYRWRDWLRRV